MPIDSLPGHARLSPDLVAATAARAFAAGVPAVLLFGVTDHKDGAGSAAYEPGGVVQAAVAAIKDAVPEMVVVTDVCLCAYTDHGHCGVVDRRRGPQRPQPGAPGADRGEPRGRRRRHRRAQRHDGRARGGDPGGARRRGPRGHRDHGLLRQVRLGLLRALPRGRRLGAGLRRPARVPDGPGQRARGRARGAARRRRGRGHGDGQARRRLSRRHRGGARGHRPAPGGLPRQRGVLDAEGGGRARVARRAHRGHGDPHRHRPRRRRPAHHLLRRGRRAVAAGRAGHDHDPPHRPHRVQAGRGRSRAAQPAPGGPRHGAGAVRRDRVADRDGRGGGAAAPPAPEGRVHRAPALGDLRHPGPGVHQQPGGGALSGRPPVRGRGHRGRASGREPQLPAHPRVQPLVHARRGARLPAGARGHDGAAGRGDRRPSRCACCRR